MTFLAPKIFKVQTNLLHAAAQEIPTPQKWCTCADTPCWAHSGGWWSFCSCCIHCFSLDPDREQKVSWTLSCLWSLLCSVFINQTNLSELLWASEKPLICCSMPLCPWRLCWWHLARIQRTEDATKLPLKSIMWVSVFIRDALKLSHQDHTQLFLYDLFLSFIYLCVSLKQ